MVVSFMKVLRKANFRDLFMNHNGMGCRFFLFFLNFPGEIYFQHHVFYLVLPACRMFCKRMNVKHRCEQVDGS